MYVCECVFVNLKACFINPHAISAFLTEIMKPHKHIHMRMYIRVSQKKKSRIYGLKATNTQRKNITASQNCLLQIKKCRRALKCN